MPEHILIQKTFALDRFLLFQAYGNAAIYHELCYSIYSLLNLYQGPPPFEIVVYTDNPPLLQERLPKGIKYYLLDKSKQTEWAGNAGFIHRIKVMILLDFMSNHQGSIVYSDTDTYFMKPIEPLYDWVEHKNYVVHITEGVINSKSNNIFRRLNSFLSKHPNFQISPSQTMFNAGILGIMSSDSDVVKEALELTDNLYSAFPAHISEQLAFSYCFEKTRPVKEAYEFVYHYWNFKEFRNVLKAFFDFYKNVPYPILKQKIHRINPVELHQPKLDYEKLSFWPKAYRKFTNSRWTLPQYKLD